MRHETSIHEARLAVIECRATEASSLKRWAHDNSRHIIEKIVEHGGVLLEGLPCRTAQHFEWVMSSLFSKLSDYVGGTSPRDIVHNKIMSATRTPEDWSIIPHQEMAYTSNLPDVIAFFCKKPARVGGTSTITDMRRAARDIDPEIVGRLTRGGLQLCRTLPSADRVHLKPGIQKSWEEVFATKERHAAEAIARARGWRVTWHGDDLNLWQEKVDAVRVHRLTGEAIWCNQAHFFNPASMIAWAERDGRRRDAAELRVAIKTHPELLDRMHLGGGEPVADEDALHILETLQRHEMGIDLRATDILILDNLRIAHGRTAFKGARELLVALAHWEDVEARS